MAYRIEKDDIVIDGWEQGITDNPYEGIFDMRNVDTVTIPGEASVSLSTQSTHTQASISSTQVIYLDDVNEVLGYNGTIPLEVNTAIIFTTTGTLPTGISVNTPYYIKSLIGADKFTISAISAGGTTLNFTGIGTGDHFFSTIDIGIPKYMSQTAVGTQYVNFMLDSNGRAWVYDSTNLGGTNKWIYMNNNTSEQSVFMGKGNGIMTWKNWLFVFGFGNNIDCIYLKNNLALSTLAYLTTKSNWNFAWKTASGDASLSSHYSLIGQDDVFYFCNGTAVGSVIEVANSQFAPCTGRVVNDGVTTLNDNTITSASINFTNLDLGAIITGTGIPANTYIIAISSATTALLSNVATASGTGITFTITTSYTYNNTAVSLPSSDEAICLAELGTNLLIGGRNNYIYPWDRISPSFSFPIFLSERYVTRMVTINTTCYIFCGFKGRIYVTNGANATPFYKIPDYLSKTTNPYIVWKDANFNRNQLYFGFSATTNSGTTVNEYGGLWGVDVDSVSPVSPRLENIMSYGTYGGYVSAIMPNRGLFTTSVPSSDGYGLFTGWYNGTIGGVDIGISTPYTGGQSYIDCDPLPVGTFLKPRTYENIQFKLGTPLVAGESVAFYYRKNIADAYTALPITQGNGTGDISGIAYSNFENAQWLQIRVVLTSTATNPSFVRLREIRIH